MRASLDRFPEGTALDSRKGLCTLGGRGPNEVKVRS